jgi:hypothetical protein
MADSGITIPDAHVLHSFEILKSGDHAAARGAYEWSERALKTVLADEAAKSTATSQGQRDQDALRSERYKEALREFRKVAELYFHERDRRDAAQAILDAWRSIQANQRLLGKII